MSKVEDLAQRLRQDQPNSVVISKHRAIPEIVAGFILGQVGVLSSEAVLDHPQVWYSREMSTEVRDRNLLLFHQDILNPTLLSGLILSSNLHGRAKSELFKLANFLQHYRSYKIENWIEAREHIKEHKGTKNQLDLLDYLTMVVDANFEDPVRTFVQGISALRRLFYRDDGFNMRDLMTPLELEVPRLKNEGNQPDIVDTAHFTFDRARIHYLAGRHFPFVVGGATHSGKSTFTASLHEAMLEIIDRCEKEGILGDRAVSVEICDLDKTSPTTKSISKGTRPLRGATKQWNEEMAKEAAEMFRYMSGRNTIVLGDLPGGTPDQFTDILAREARFSILVSRAYNGGELQDWRKFFTSTSQQTNLVRVHTRFEEEDRISGIRNYSVLAKGSRRDLLWGRVVDLDRRLKPYDEFIWFAAHALLFEYLPEMVINEYSAHYRLHKSLEERFDYDHG